MFTVNIHYRAGGSKSAYLRRPTPQDRDYRDKFLRRDLWYMRLPEPHAMTVESRQDGWLDLYETVRSRVEFILKPEAARLLELLEIAHVEVTPPVHATPPPFQPSNMIGDVKPTPSIHDVLPAPPLPETETVLRLHHLLTVRQASENVRQKEKEALRTECAELWCDEHLANEENVRLRRILRKDDVARGRITQQWAAFVRTTEELCY
ncbi:uncharacterized protein B0H18DRAFT_957904 [Fomitopsis serialis]|uniref:uncharacterized protein n=1 Tax=Fomitopsis serialis TaxID=139415 RepID=UPI00200840D1|nr:uncharacterized protein B0H18DRAFT_957904 [Neoantrodia serialis]KAH9918501.1 hypothetical protein B0H18DRAFT_957904 [Neoantrodia serialis]